MEIAVDPAHGLVDRVPSVSVSEVAAGESVVLTVRAVDASKRTWQSRGSYAVGTDGALEMADPSYPWWSMRDTSPGSVPVVFAASPTSIDFSIAVKYRGATAETVVRRMWGVDAVTMSETAGSGWSLRTYEQPEPVARPAILYVPGSMGMESVAPMAALFASHGYVTGVLGYAGLPGLPASMERIPVEVVTAGLRALAESASVDPQRIGIYSTSVGVPLALAALAVAQWPSDVPQVRAVVATSPSSVVWQALGEGRPPKASSLTREGVEVHWLPMRDTAVLGQMLTNMVRKKVSRRPVSTALRLHDVYAKALDDTTRVESATIPVELIKAPMLLLAGQADVMWPSATMAENIIGRRRRFAHSDDRLMLFPDAGHFLRTPVIPTTADRTLELISGGTPSGEAAAEQRAWDATLSFLEAQLT